MKCLQWTPVSQRLPVDELNRYRERYGNWSCQEFIVYIDGAEIPTVLCFDGENFFEEGDGETYYDVTHWMCMPPRPSDCVVDVDLGDQIEANFELLEAIMLGGVCGA